MFHKRRPWQEELEIIDRVMKAVSDVRDPEQMVDIYWTGIAELLPMEHFLALSRRGIDPPEYLITRSSRFTEHLNPWTQRNRLPRMTGGILGEIAYADKPVVIDDLPSRLAPDDPAYFYLQGFHSLIASPQYEGGKGLNVGIHLFEPGVELDHTTIPMLHWQAGLFGRGTLSLVLRNQLQEALSELDRELQVVGEIQRSLLPKELPQLPGLQLAAHYETSARAGGDYYDFFPLDRNCCGIFIADVSGHGTPAAVLMAITHAIAHTRPGYPHPPGELLAHLNTHLVQSYTAAGTFVTAFYAALDPVSRRLVYSIAGHNPPRLLRNGKIISIDKLGGLPLGVLPVETYGESSITLEPGDLLLLYTDGITEAMTPPDEKGIRDMFTVARLDELLMECETSTAEECIECIKQAVRKFTRNAPPSDDQTLIAVRCLR